LPLLLTAGIDTLCPAQTINHFVLNCIWLGRRYCSASLRNIERNKELENPQIEPPRLPIPVWVLHQPLLFFLAFLFGLCYRVLEYQPLVDLFHWPNIRNALI
jgi:hypothetical protein